MARKPVIDYDVHFGEIGRVVDWKSYDEPDPDDEELAQTPEDVVKLLGFDPLEAEEDYQEGGPGSGFFGHAGRPGQVGGSSSEGGADASERGSTKERKDFETNLSSLTDAEKHAIDEWTHSGFIMMRKVLLNMKDISPFNAIELLDSHADAKILLGILKKYKSEETMAKPIYRGLRMQPKQFEALKNSLEVGKEYYPDKTLSSWSTSSVRASQFTSGLNVCVLLEIEGGRKNSFEVSLKKVSFAPLEEEVLTLPRRYKFKRMSEKEDEFGKPIYIFTFGE